MVHTIVWALICVLWVSHHHDGHKWPPWTTNRGSEQVSSPPCMFFFLFFLTNVNFELNRLCHSHLTPPPATPQWVDHINARWHPTAKKMPKRRFIPSFGPRCACHVTTMATNCHHGQWTGARDLSWAPHVCFFFFLFSMLAWNFNEKDYVIWHHLHQLHLNELTMSTHQDGTLQHKKMPKRWFIPSFGPQCALSSMSPHGCKSLPWTTNRGSRQVLSPQCMLLYFFYFYTNVNFY